ncbi:MULTISPECIES: helix-turn-helix domain-containing protein [Agrobacterium tumefaciens complex]|jgi:transcriptional regulator with XRE-family HTH domain|uniref:Transcriptional regulator with XRE-family HTH domain n=2 Tax=Agrobacterium tumefaciens complex TaxID=1183400 RepID=A0AAW8M2Q7_AGRTU|nr:helix-turn-helix transcriptional regulator [Agrobacterium tumefaciens]MBB4283635.1 transcriptional regulator with XRE-family HTH domain [Agrobacterium radiobacter]MBB4321483.1 transcriptional regulator with XRE-family HTH domain [Agrobacterium radiobacter]MBB4325566.1 transcriptional regulator with XRE-family HTH domain [Agrobacterium radiobacter]MBB4338522.1 transcriptional regulator with XRE-family HTH domain [Agrobacterium radiobacter]MBB4409506.1 transcriptional regulator with XRE-famil
MTAKDLATKVSISAPYLSEIESGKKAGSLTVLRKIAQTVNVDIDDLA